MLDDPNEELLTSEDIYQAALRALNDPDALSRLLLTVALRIAQTGTVLAEQRLDQTLLECQMIDEGDSTGKRLSVAEAQRRAVVALNGGADRAQAHLDGLHALYKAIEQRLAVLAPGLRALE
jgi:hypothetical protein